MYPVTVFDGRECIDTRDFDYGTWNEIGLWLDHYGYNDSRYTVQVRFSDK